MNCDIQYVVAPNGEISKLFGQLVELTGDKKRAAKLYLDAMDINTDQLNDQGDPELDVLVNMGLLNDTEVMRYQKGPSGYRQTAIEDDVIKQVSQQINNAISSIEKQLNQSLPEGEQENLRDQVRELKKDKRKLESETLFNVRQVANRHFQWAKILMNNSSASSRDILQAIRLMDFWDTDITFQFLSEDQRKNEDNIYNETFSDIGSKATNIRVNLVSTALDRITNEVNKRSEKEYTKEELFELGEIGWAKENLFNISHVDQPLIQHLDVVLKNAYNASTSIVKSMNQRFNEFEEDVDPSVILRKDENGDPIDEFIGPFSQEYQEKRAAAQARYSNARRNSNDEKELLLKARKNLYDSLNDIEILIDPNKLDDIEAYKQELIDKGVPESIANYAVEEAKLSLEKFNKARREFKETVDVEINSGLWQSKAFENETPTEYRKRKMKQYDKNNSPYLYYRDRQRDNPEFAYNSGYKYTNSVPKPNNDYYDEAFQNLSDRKLEFWKYTTGLLSSAQSFLPEPVTRGLDERFFPLIKKTIVEHFKSNGAFYAGKSAFKDFMDNIRSLEEKELTEEEDDELDAFRGPADRDQVPIKYIGDSDLPKRNVAESIDHIQTRIDKLENDYQSNSIPEEEYEKEISSLKDKLKKLKEKKKDQSLDVIRATQMFVSMALRYKNMTDVSAHGELIHRLIDEANTVNPNGGISSLGKLKNAVKEEINYLVYSVSRKHDEGMSNMFDNVTDNPLNSASSRRRRKELENMRDELDKQLEDGKITQLEWESEMDPLKKEYKELGGKNLVWSKVVDHTLLPYAQLKGMGLNIGAAFRNLGYGIFTNFVHAAGGKDFEDKHVIQAMRIMLQDREKVRSLVDKFGILFEVADIEYGNDRDFEAFDPYVLQGTTEFFGQGLTLVATMLNTTVTDAEGNERSLWSAYDSKGNWNQEEFGQGSEWRTAEATVDLLDNDGRELEEFKRKIVQLNNRLHGDYARNSKQLLKKSVLGRLISMFRTWIPEAVAYRFGEERYDKHLGRQVIGSYRGTGRAIRDNDLGETLSYITKSFVPFMKPDTENSTISDKEQEAIKRSMREMQIYTALAITILAIKDGIGDDDEMSNKRKILINNLIMLQQDIGLFVSPRAMIQLAENPVPAVSIYVDFDNLMTSTHKYLTDEEYQGDHPVFKLTKATPILKQMNTIKWQSERLIE